ncbi:hypothetical protein GH733_011332, partial [Mirounga leonina]
MEAQNLQLLFRSLRKTLAVKVTLLKGWIQVCHTVLITHGDGAFVEMISLPRNDLLKRPNTLAAEGHPIMDASSCSRALAPNHANAKLFEVPFLELEGQRTEAI